MLTHLAQRAILVAERACFALERLFHCVVGLLVRARDGKLALQCVKFAAKRLALALALARGATAFAERRSLALRRAKRRSTARALLAQPRELCLRALRRRLQRC